MKHIKLKHYSDAAHGWISVKRDLLISLGIESEVSNYSYQSKTGGTVYLEEDRDLRLLLEAMPEIDVNRDLKYFCHGDKSYIRNLPSFRPITGSVSK